MTPYSIARRHRGCERSLRSWEGSVTLGIMERKEQLCQEGKPVVQKYNSKIEFYFSVAPDGMWILVPRPGIEPVSSALSSGVLTTGLPGKSKPMIQKRALQEILGFPGGSDGKESACNVGDLGSIPGLGRSPGGGHGNPRQYYCLENPHGWRSLVGYSPWGDKELETTERLSTLSLTASSMTGGWFEPELEFFCFSQN